MVYCPECGKKNMVGAKVCANCGESLNPRRVKKRRPSDECFGPAREAEECFGLPYGGKIVGIIFGILIIVVGIGIYFGRDLWHMFWPGVIVIVGILIIAGALYGLKRGS